MPSATKNVAPTINSVISGTGVIEGNFTLESAKALSDQLNAGALPVPLELQETRKLEATLGAEAVRITRAGGVDVSSGVERAPGVKDFDLIRDFVRAARATEELTIR